MHRSTKTQMQATSLSIPKTLMLTTAALLAAIPGLAQSAPAPSAQPTHVARAKAHHRATPAAALPVVAQTPPPPPMPRWPVNESPNPASVVWDASGLRINASNSSLQQILSEVSTDTGTKVVGSVPDQRVFGTYGPGQAADVLLQLLQGSGYNVLLAGDLGHGAPSQIVLTPRNAGGSSAPAARNPQQQQMQPQQDSDDETPEQPEPPEEQPAAQEPPPTNNNQVQPGLGPNGPMRTPQEIMQEMQQRQLLQQQQMQMQQQQQQQQQGNPTAPQQQQPPD
jgi:hypothetical protein